MNIILMLGVTACYTISSLSDKYAVSKARFTGNEFTFLMCSSLSVFIALTLPFQEIYFSLSWQSFAAILLIAVCKLLEFQMSALVLKQLSAFELKAWLGVTLFVSYMTDVFYGADLRLLKLLCIAATAVGLVFIAKSGKETKIEYRKIAVPLLLYLAVKYGYGLVIKAFTPYISPTCTPSMMTALAPTSTLSSMMTGVALAGSTTPASTAPAPIWQFLPTVARPPRTAPISIMVPSPMIAPMLMMAPIMMTALSPIST